jgi:branched-chain amino acid transport system substrate-binding protein
MDFGCDVRQWRVVAAICVVAAVTACSPGTFNFGSRTLDFSDPPASNQPMTMLPAGPSESFGRGPVPVTLLLPLSGDPTLAGVGRSLANASRLAIGFIEANPNIAENITITLRDTGGTAAGATAAASAAISSGARLILGPLGGEEVLAASGVARAAGVPMMAFSNNPAAAGQGVYLLSVLPEVEMKRAVAYITQQGRRGMAAAFPATPYGEALAAAFRQQVAAAGLSPQSIFTYASASDLVPIVNQALPDIQRGAIDTLFIPDRSAAQPVAQMLAQAGVMNVQLVGSADWENDATLLANPALANAVFPAVDRAGLLAITPDYQARFGAPPHAMATIAYTATILANVNTLSLATPPYNPGLMTSGAGFNGRDGVFRFLPNGRAEYGLVIKQISGGAAVVVDGVRI